MADIETFKEKLESLITKFEKDKHHYLSKGYLEAQLRIDFLNPLFEALGWDIENRAHKPPHDRDVIVELSPEATGRPDYNFRINGATKFFIEAKSPSVALDDVNHILQAKTYAWSTKEVYFVILTDFEEFKLFDASLKPNSRYPNEGLIFDFKYTDYLKNIDKLYNLSKEEVEKGSLEKLLPRDVKSKRLRIPVDKAFLEDMTAWREELAKDIYKRNPQIDVKVLNEVVQKLLDRIVFIRIAEDRKIRDANELKDIVELWRHEGKRKPILNHLKDLFYEVNDDLNGDIFKPHACESIDVDSNLLADIIENLYFPKCRYRFDVIGVELLGSIYERYLGSTIRVTPQRIKVEEKPEVRKAGGVYYTPKYIVEYIVKNTVGKLIEGKTPKQIEKIKILDPACGSGSFLLGAYQYLIDYHLKYYREHPKETQTLYLFPYYKMSPEEFNLPLREKAKILRNNIFGVDIDPQAVEITMMSLYLKALEGERGILPKKQHLLPPLTNNIKCGNSLIGYDIFEDSPLLRGVRGVFSPLTEDGEGEFSDETKSRINPFDWNSKTAGFGVIMENGGFDCVIGNPPYIAFQEGDNITKNYYINKYLSAKGKYDQYILFTEKSLFLLKKLGFFGFIIPNKFIHSHYGEGIKQVLLKNKIIEIIDFNDMQVFQNVTNYPCIILVSKDIGKNFFQYKTVKTIKGSLFESADIKIKQTGLSNTSWILTDKKEGSIFEKIKRQGSTLDDISNAITQGLRTGSLNIYYKNVTKDFIKNKKLEKDLILYVYHGKNIKRYESLIDTEKDLLLFPYKSDYITPVDIDNYPNVKNYLKDYTDELRNRKDSGKIFKNTNKIWFEYWDPKPICFKTPKIIFPDISRQNNFYLDLDGIGYLNTCYAIYLKTGIEYKYILGILNSKVIEFFIKKICPFVRGGYYRYKTNYIKQLPIHTIDFNNPKEKAVHDKLASLVDRMLELHKKKNSLPPSVEREKVEREIAVTDEKIDEIVYGLYGITEEERKVIEGQ